MEDIYPGIDDPNIFYGDINIKKMNMAKKCIEIFKEDDVNIFIRPSEITQINQESSITSMLNRCKEIEIDIINLDKEENFLDFHESMKTKTQKKFDEMSSILNKSIVAFQNKIIQKINILNKSNLKNLKENIEEIKKKIMNFKNESDSVKIYEEIISLYKKIKNEINENDHLNKN